MQTWVKLGVSALIGVGFLTGLAGCGKSLTQVKASADKAIDGGVAMTDKLATELGHAAQAVPGIANTVGSIAKEAVSIGIAVYQDAKENYETVKKAVGLN